MTTIVALSLLALGLRADACMPATVTFYAAQDYPGIVRDGTTTTWGALSRGEQIVAVDPRVVPLGSWVWVEGLGTARAADTGGAVRGAHVDWLVSDHADAMIRGRSERTICVQAPGEW